MRYIPSIDLFVIETQEVSDYLHPHQGLHELIVDRLGRFVSHAETQPIRSAMVANWKAKDALLGAFLIRYQGRIDDESKSVQEFQHFG
jgi:hypothetical protein